MLTNLKEDGVITNEVRVQTGTVNLMMANSATKRRRAGNSVVTMAAAEESGVSLTYIVKDSEGSGA